MTAEENKSHEIPKYIKITNPKSEFFTNSGISWELNSKDIDLLTSLGK